MEKLILKNDIEKKLWIDIYKIAAAKQKIYPEDFADDSIKEFRKRNTQTIKTEWNKI
jgi:hypothetical protein